MDNKDCKKAQWDTLALNLIKKRYLADSNNVDVEKWLVSVAKHITKNYLNTLEKEYWIKEYTELFLNRTFFPTTATLVNCLSDQGSLAGCMVLPLAETLSDIINESIPQILSMLRYGVGIGIDLSHLTPRLGRDEIAGRAFPGAVEILFSIVQCADGLMNYAGLKRAAFMASLSVYHPDIFTFIRCKTEKNMRAVNISIAVDKEFNQALNSNDYVSAYWINNNKKTYLTPNDLQEMQYRAFQRTVEPPDLKLIENNKVYSEAANQIVGLVCNNKIMFNPNTLLQIAAKNAHKCGDPGIINLEAINQFNPTGDLGDPIGIKSLGTGEIRVTTPCGEQPLLPYEVCHLGSIALPRFIQNNSFQFDSLKKTVPTIVQLMDDIIDVGDNGLEQANIVSKSNRKIGIGIMGLADVLAELMIPYNSDKALKFTRDIMKIIQSESLKASEQLAEVRGSFPNWQNSKFAKSGQKPRRHATLTTIAPTGHISTLAGCSTSIEPYFLIEYQREAAGLHIERTNILDKKLAAMGYSLEQWIKDTQNTDKNFYFDGTLKYLSDIPISKPNLSADIKEIKKVFLTAHEISPLEHLNMVKAIQNIVDNGVSKTINLPNESSVNEVYEIFLKSLQYNLKGITVYRDNSKQEQALTKKSVSVESDCNC